MKFILIFSLLLFNTANATSYSQDDFISIANDGKLEQSRSDQLDTNCADDANTTCWKACHKANANWEYCYNMCGSGSGCYWSCEPFGYYFPNCAPKCK